jgi:hypothetical protein
VRDDCAVADVVERFVELDRYGVIPSPAGAGALLLHGEGDRHAQVVMHVWSQSERRNRRALVTLEECRQSVFGYPNDEAYFRDPRGDSRVPGYGFYEVLDSEWPARLAEFNRHAFPPERDLEWGRHFFIGCHDGSGQFLAQELSVEVFDDPYPEIVEVAVSRMLAW